MSKLKALEVTPEDALEYLERAWKHCLRCRLCEHRTEVDHAKGKHFGTVPFSEWGKYAWASDQKEGMPHNHTWHFLLEAPDTVQQEHGKISVTETSRGEVFEASPNSGFFDWTFGLLEGQLPGSKTDCGFSFAMGCRPIDFLYTTRLVKPSSSAAKRCRAKWSLELGIGMPILTYISGPNALSVVRPDLGTTTKYATLRGEVIPFQVPVKRSPERMPEMMTLYGYVGPSIETVLRTANDEQLYGVQPGGWEPEPCGNPSSEPMLDWLWHVTWYMWLAETLRQQIFEEKAHLPYQMVELSETLNRWYEYKSHGLEDIENFLAQIRKDFLQVRESMENPDGYEGDDIDQSFRDEGDDEE